MIFLLIHQKNNPILTNVIIQNLKLELKFIVLYKYKAFTQKKGYFN